MDIIMKRPFILLLAIVFFISTAQAKTKKFGTWIEAEVTKDIIKKLELSFVPEIRLQDDFSVDEYMGEIGLTYKSAKFFNLGASYRLSKDIKKSSTLTFHRFALNALGKKEWKRIEGSLRLRFTNYSEAEDEDVKNNYLRPRLKFVYDIKNNPVAPYTSYELFYNLSDSQIDKSRFDIGATCKVSDKSRVGLYYRLQSYFGDKNAIHILGLSYKLSL